VNSETCFVRPVSLLVLEILQKLSFVQVQKYCRIENQAEELKEELQAILTFLPNFNNFLYMLRYLFRDFYYIIL
jgi:hypothetical protein